MAAEFDRFPISLSVWEWRLIVDALDELAAHTPDWHEADKIAGLSFHVEALLRKVEYDSVSRV